MSGVIGLQRGNNYTATDIAQGRGFAVLDEIQDQDGNIFKFATASGTVAQFDVVAITSAGIAQAVTSALANAGAVIGVAQAALSSAESGWVQVFGITTVQVLSTCSSGTALFTSGTAGKLDDTSTSQTKIAGVQILANITASGSTLGVLTTRPFAAL